MISLLYFSYRLKIITAPYSIQGIAYDVTNFVIQYVMAEGFVTWLTSQTEWVSAALVRQACTYTYEGCARTQMHSWTHLNVSINIGCSRDID